MDARMIEPDELELSVGARYLLVDLNNGWNVTRSGGGAPGVVMPGLERPKPRSLPRTKGQPSDAAIQELLSSGFADPVDETFPQPIKPTDKGLRYYRQHLSHRFQPAQP